MILHRVIAFCLFYVTTAYINNGLSCGKAYCICRDILHGIVNNNKKKTAVQTV